MEKLSDKIDFLIFYWFSDPYTILAKFGTERSKFIFSALQHLSESKKFILSFYEEDLETVEHSRKPFVNAYYDALMFEYNIIVDLYNERKYFWMPKKSYYK